MSASTAQPQIAFSNSFCTDAQSTPSRLGIAIAKASSTPASIPMFTRLSRFTFSGATSSTPGGGRRVGAQLLQGLAEVLLTPADRLRERRRLHQRDRRGHAILAHRRDRGGNGAVGADDQRASS